MKRVFLSILCLCLAFNMFAQHAKGDVNVNLGVGLLGNFGVGSMKLPPINVSVEYGIQDKISVGGFAAFSIWGDDFVGSSYKSTYITVGARGSYHFLQSEKLDPYAGIFLGYHFVNVTWDGTASNSVGASGFGWGGHLGARYKFSEKLGAFAELGYGISVINLGVNFKL